MDKLDPRQAQILTLMQAGEQKHSKRKAKRNKRFKTSQRQHQNTKYLHSHKAGGLDGLH